MRNKLILDSAQRHVPSAFKHGKSMSEQLRQERMELQSTALKGDHGGSKDLTIHPNILKTYQYVKQYMKARSLTWHQITNLANQAGFRTQKGREWKSNKLREYMLNLEEFND